MEQMVMMNNELNLEELEDVTGGCFRCKLEDLIYTVGGAVLGTAYGTATNGGIFGSIASGLAGSKLGSALADKKAQNRHG